MSRQTYTGVDLVEAAETVMLQRWRELWPYIHVYPPPDAIPVHEIGYIANPGQGGTAEVLRYQVQPGLRFIMQAILQVWVGGAAPAPGDALWTVSVNSDVSSSVQSMPVNGLSDVPVPLGSVEAGNKWPFERAYEFKGQDVVRSVVDNVNLIDGFFVSGFFGYLVPDLLIGDD